MTYEIGRVYIWQNQVGVNACLNGTETTVLSGPHRDADGLYWRTDTESPEHRGDPSWEFVAESGDLKPKDPPSGERCILDLFQPHPEEILA